VSCTFFIFFYTLCFTNKYHQLCCSTLSHPNLSLAAVLRGPKWRQLEYVAVELEGMSDTDTTLCQATTLTTNYLWMMEKLHCIISTRTGGIGAVTFCRCRSGCLICKWELQPRSMCIKHCIALSPHTIANNLQICKLFV
jgi:hypothetical protein